MLCAGLSLSTALLGLPPQAQAAGFGPYMADVQPADVFPGADRFGPMEGTPPSAPAYKGDQIVGYVFRTEDIGYSGKPIKLLVGMDLDGVIVGAKVVEHHEPILLVGIPQDRLFEFVARFVGKNVVATARNGQKAEVDAISGATVTAIVINDGLTRAALAVAKSRGVAGFSAVAGAVAPAAKTGLVLADIPFVPSDWTSLLGEGSIRRLHLLNGEVDDAFKKIGVGRAGPYGHEGPPEAEFIDLYLGLVSVETIGRSLIDEQNYSTIRSWLKPGQSAIVIAANGEYSFRGSGFVRGGIFDRIQLAQGDTTILFKDKDYKRLGALGGDAPEFQEIGIFRIPDGAIFDPAQPFRFQLLAQRPTGPTEKVFTSFSLDYRLPDKYLKTEAIVPASAPPPALPSSAEQPAASTAGELAADQMPAGEPVWVKIWRSRVIDIAILTISLVILTLIFFFQDVLVRKPKLFTRLRIGFLVFSVVWLGFYAGAQLSVVNVLTFTNALAQGFRWDFFLLEPLIFILWSATAAALLFWGRGAFCGWLCPFGALQELANQLARRLGVRQLAIPFAWHERLWPVKYIIFLGLFGLSLNNLALAERIAEVEPFKTTILLHFMRDWPYVLYAVALLGAGVFVERFFCRYLCPLGAALAIPGRIRMFEWLKRRKQCGFECQLCAKECMVQAIHPLGQINPNECLYCMKCQVIYWDDQTCPPLIIKRTGRGKKRPIASTATTGGAQPAE
jgi:NosR/NirI family nitrous oxide reductase transcriptional regulator